MVAEKFVFENHDFCCFAMISNDLSQNTVNIAQKVSPAQDLNEFFCASVFSEMVQAFYKRLKA